MSVRFIGFIISVISLISLLSFCLVDLSIGERGVVKSPTIRVWGLMYALSSSNAFFYICGWSCIRGIDIQD